jgi:hypothetical protein
MMTLNLRQQLAKNPRDFYKNVYLRGEVTQWKLQFFQTEMEIILPNA